MNIDYRQRMVDFALAAVGTGAPDDFFRKNYLETIPHAGSNADDSARFITWCARMVGVPITHIPNLYYNDDLMGDWIDVQDGKGSLENATAGDIIHTESNNLGIIVAAQDPKKITVVEAGKNASGKYNVWKKNYSRGSKLIWEYLPVNYDVNPSISVVSNQTKLSRLVKNTYISQFQDWLYNKVALLKESSGAVDTDMKEAVTSYYNSMAPGLPRSLRVKTSGDNVYFLQGLLYSHGYDPKGLDGEFGEGTKAALKSFQATRKLSITGNTNKDTWFSLTGRWTK